jgi:hypothetical protein
MVHLFLKKYMVITSQQVLVKLSQMRFLLIKNKCNMKLIKKNRFNRHLKSSREWLYGLPCSSYYLFSFQLAFCMFMIKWWHLNILFKWEPKKLTSNYIILINEFYSIDFLTNIGEDEEFWYPEYHTKRRGTKYGKNGIQFQWL